MMKRYLLSIILGFLAMTNFSYGQVGISFAEETADANGTVDIDVTVNGFTNISVLQFSAAWDSLVMTFNSVTFTNPALIDLVPSNIGSPMGSANVDEGQFSFSYGNPNGNGVLNDGDVIFTVRFDVVGNECDETTIDFTDDPTPIDAYDNNFSQLTVTPNPGSMQINGPDCGTIGEDDLTFNIDDNIMADAGTNICIPITVENFIDIQTGTGTILWDPTVISYTGLANIALSGLGGSLNETQTDNGELKFIWSNPDPGNPVTLADGATVFELCFDIIGDVGDMSSITLSTQGTLGFLWGNDDVNELPLDLNNGKVTVTETVGDPFILNVTDYIAGENETNACVDISIQNFNDVLGMQFVVTWDESILTNATPSNFNLEGLSSSSFNIDGNCATMSWNVNTGFSLADGTQIFSMCFDVIGPCDSSSAVDLVSKGSTDIEILDGNTMPLPNVMVNAGSITVDCVPDPMCAILSIDKTCNGALGGNVTVDVPTTNCTYSWANSSGTEVSTDKNLLGVAAGTYILTVTCDGAETCTLSATVENYPDLVIDDGSPTNAACGDKGALDVIVSFGSGNYSYNWNPTQADSPNISDLDPGTYDLTVTDEDNGCTQTAQFNIIDEVEVLVISSSQVIDETCLAGNGRITLTIDGGCQPYKFEWSHSDINSPIAANLTAGSYQVTVSDDSSPANTATGSYTVDGTDPITQVGTADITPSSGSNGSIEIEVTGGEPDYSYNWSGPTTNLPNSNSISGLMDGEYNVTVTDANGCMDTLGPFIVLFFDDTIDSVMVEGIQAVNDANDFSVMCNGDMNGVIVGTIMAGEMPYTIELSGDESRIIEVDNPGTFSIDSLSAGTYTVTVSNNINSVSESNIIISEPDPLESSVEMGCDSEEQCDGFIDLNISGGVGALSVNWGNPDLSGESLNDLCEGFYTAITTDENGCERMDAVTIESCEDRPNPDCYQIRDVITPNDDGMNDQFTVTCINDFPASLEVFDRWGKLVFSQDAYDGTWMGVSNSNEELIEGGYMYIINIDFGEGRREIMKGTLTLLRD